MKRVVVALAVAAGCSGVAPREEWHGTVETLPNGAVRVTSPAEGMWPRGGGWRLTPTVEIGVADGDAHQMFSDISAFEVGADDRIYIVDRDANELRIFGPDGGHLRTVGRNGDGPGEFRGANGLAWLADDSLVVIDQQGARYSVLTADGEFVRSVPRQHPFFSWIFRGGLADGRLYEEYAVRNGPEDRLPALFGTPLRVGPGSTEVIDTILLPTTGAPLIETYSVRTKRGIGMSMTVPFTPAAVYHLDPRPHVWFGHGSALHLFEVTAAGDTVREVLIDAVPVPVTEAERNEWLSGSFVKRFQEMGGDLDLGRIPKTKPLFDGIYRSSDGDLWIAVPVAPEETEFAVLDSVGRYLGRVRTSGFRRDEFVPPVIRNGRLFLLGRDSLGVAKIYGFRVER